MWKISVISSAFCHPDAYQDLEGEQGKYIRRSRNKFGITPRKVSNVNVFEDPESNLLHIGLFRYLKDAWLD
ncbi:hypothetical protein [Marinoscillum pacificum]|uniref:hypothetical protein n=1 Tax=Marinoscillum pacificum TaxID=392723 RepID=UPI0021577390|nr:hypothetical protein [Marinoscillum pacificum]